ncbi:cell division site-positioning protein MapZ family protein [Aerococcaceae bacterium NML180378]|nr:cell division site-positioning protein MapZ family protein [Aerococcaceae bacterium NML180378]
MTIHESRLARHKKNWLNEHRVIGQIIASLIGISLALWLILPYVFGDSGEQVAAAKKSVAALFYDKNEDFLNEKITKEQLNSAERQVNALKGIARNNLEKRLASAHQKFQAIEQLNDIYDSEQPLIVGNEVAEVTLLKEGVTKEQIRKALSAQPNSTDSFGKTVATLYTKANDILDNIDKANELINALPTTIKTGESLSELVEQLKEVDEVMAPIKEQPQFKAGLAKFQKTTKALSEAILGESEERPMNEEVAERLFECQALAQHLSGTAVDRRPMIALTFDDGPNDTYTPQVLDILAKHKVKGTFFVMGAYVDDHPEMAKRIVSEGHQIANHTYTHPDLAALSDEKVLQEIEWTQESIRDVTGVTPDLYRLPFGSGGARVVKLLKPMTSIIWNVDSEDWMSKNKQAIMNQVLSTLQRQSILLMHDTHQATPDALDELIPILKEKGYRFVMPEDIPFDYHYY